jgi:hypothetical protein
LEVHVIFGGLHTIIAFIVPVLFCSGRYSNIPWFLHQSASVASGPSSWLQLRKPGFDSRRYQIFWEVMGLERGPLSLVSTIEELLGTKNSGLGLESREYCLRGP